ncbi:MAG: hypothetical protein KA369_05560 [Spirochaetes bacterium]|nr:hypothetical protein [Spirochaetota bacterium]
MFARKKNEFRLDVGDRTIAMVCPSEKHVMAFMEYFGTDNSNKDPEIILDIEIAHQEKTVDIPDSLFTTKKISGPIIDIAGGLVQGESGPDPNTIKIRVSDALTSGPVSRVFEQLLYQAFYSCCKISNSDSLLIHCSGVIYRGNGYLFVGPSGSGKSTIAALSEEHHIMNDEICLIDFSGKTVSCLGTPFNGYYKKKRKGSALLKSIFLIDHGKEHRISDISRREAVTMLAKEIIPPVALMDEFSPRIFIHMMDQADKIYDLVPMRKLEFLQDKGFWSEIEKEYHPQGA